MISFSSDGEACKNLLNVGLSHHLNFWDRNGEVLLGFGTLRTKKSYTCEEGGAHLRIFFLGIYWWIWKTNIYLRYCWSEPMKNVRILIFTMLYF